MTTPNDKPYEQWTEAERKAFSDEQNARYRRILAKTEAALAPWREYMGEAMTHRQQYAVESVIRQAVETADYSGNRDLRVDIEMERKTSGRKHSPNGTFWVSFKVVLLDPKSFGGAQGFFWLGKRAKVSGSLFDNSLFGREKKLGK